MRLRGTHPRLQVPHNRSQWFAFFAGRTLALCDCKFFEKINVNKCLNWLGHRAAGRRPDRLVNWVVEIGRFLSAGGKF